MPKVVPKHLGKLDDLYKKYIDYCNKAKSEVEADEKNGAPWWYSSQAKQFENHALSAFAEYKNYYLDNKDRPGVSAYWDQNDQECQRSIIKASDCCCFSWWQRAPAFEPKPQKIPQIPLQVQTLPVSTSLGVEVAVVSSVTHTGDYKQTLGGTNLPGQASSSTPTIVSTPVTPQTPYRAGGINRKRPAPITISTSAISSASPIDHNTVIVVGGDEAPSTGNKLSL